MSETKRPLRDHNEAGIIGTAMRVVNAIPSVCGAEPGVVSILDLPLFTMRAEAPA